MTTLSIHEEASKAYREALADGCACWRCQDAGLRAVLRRVGVLLADAIEADGAALGPKTTLLIVEMDPGPCPPPSDK